MARCQAGRAPGRKFHFFLQIRLFRLRCLDNGAVR